MLVGVMFAHPRWINVPFFAAGTIKIAYDLTLYYRMSTVPLPEHGTAV
jgi:hypothetical protein